MTARMTARAALVQGPKRRPEEPAPYLGRGAGLYSEVSFQPPPARDRPSRDEDAGLRP